MEMIINIILILFIVVIVALIINCFEDKILNRKSISIANPMNLAQLPIVTMFDGDTELKFLIDSGSTHSHISRSAGRMLSGTPMSTTYTYNTSTGQDNISHKVDSILTYKDKEFKVTLFVNEGLDSAFDEVEKESGLAIDGILGTDFLKEHNYVIDFKTLKVYSKK